MSTIFARCFRRITKLNAGIDDKFFVDLLNEASDKFLGQYIIFLRFEGIIGKVTHVAQCRTNLIFEIRSILSLLNIFKHLELMGLVEPIIPLLLERDLLLLESFIHNNRQLQELSATEKGNLVEKLTKNKPKQFSLPNHIGHVHRKISQFVASQEQVQNSEVFAKFSDVAKRTLKRKLKELIEVDAIKRTTYGKKVFYSAGKAAY